MNHGTGAYTLSVVVLLEETADTTEGRVLKSEMGCLEETVDAAKGWFLKSEIGTCFHISGSATGEL
jgi:hypothetical protein